MQTSTQVRARRVAHLTPGASSLRLRATRWALANGRRMDFDALTVILAAKAEGPVPGSCGRSRPATDCVPAGDYLVNRWTEDDVWRLWWIDLSGWCALRGVPAPHGLATTMLTLLAHLDATDSFAPGSDSLEQLEAAMESAGALWRDPTASAG